MLRQRVPPRGVRRAGVWDGGAARRPAALLDSLPAACSVRGVHVSVTMDVMDIAVKPVKEFAKDSYRLVKRCTKPDRKGASKQPRMASSHAQAAARHRCCGPRAPRPFGQRGPCPATQ